MNTIFGASPCRRTGPHPDPLPSVGEGDGGDSDGAGRESLLGHRCTRPRPSIKSQAPGGRAQDPPLQVARMNVLDAASATVPRSGYLRGVGRSPEIHSLPREYVGEGPVSSRRHPGPSTKPLLCPPGLGRRGSLGSGGFPTGCPHGASLCSIGNGALRRPGVGARGEAPKTFPIPGAAGAAMLPGAHHGSARAASAGRSRCAAA